MRADHGLSTARLEGKRAVVTGGASGLGFATAERFPKEGARVVIADQDDSQLEQAAQQLGDAVVGLVRDVTDPEHGLVERSVSELGGIDCYHKTPGWRIP